MIRTLNLSKINLEPVELVLPINGKKYTIEACTGWAWLRLQATKGKGLEAAPLSDMEIFELSLGKELLDHLSKEVSAPELRRIGVTASLWQLGMSEAAAQYWESEGAVKSAAKPKPQRTAARKKK